MDYIEKHQNNQLETEIDNKQYNEASLVEIRVPVSLPYQNDWKEFERVDGAVEYNGMHYKYVERKLENGEMIYRCIPNREKVQLLNARDEFFKLVNDLQTQKPSEKKSESNNHAYKTFSFDFCGQMKHWNLSFAVKDINQSYSSHPAEALLSAFILSPEQPPEA